MKLLIVRHAEPDYSIDSLTPRGWEEAKLLAGRLEKLDVKAFYVSPLGRARDTASLTLKAMGREAEELTWLREFAPRVKKEGNDSAWDWLPGVWTAEPKFFDREQWSDTPAFQEAEVGPEYRWVVGELDKLVEKHGYVREGSLYRAERPNEDTIVLFCHFGVESVLLSRLLNIPPMLLWHGTCALPSSVTTVVTEERREGVAYFRMLGFGDTSHLYAGGMEPSFAARYCETYNTPNQRRD